MPKIGLKQLLLILVVTSAVIFGVMHFAASSKTSLTKNTQIQSVDHTEVRDMDAVATIRIDALPTQDHEYSLDDINPTRLGRLGSGQMNYPHGYSTQEYRDLIWSQIPEQPPKLLKHGGERIDGNTAYRLHMYYRYCARTPTQEKPARPLTEVDESTSNPGSSGSANLSRGAELKSKLTKLCSPIPPNTDHYLETFKWLGEAVKLGHEVAQIEYYDVAYDLLKNPLYKKTTLLERHPNLIEEFKETARIALASAMEKEHPEAFLGMSKAFFGGIVVKKDLVAAYAHAYAAGILANKNEQIMRGVRRQLVVLTPHLTSKEIIEARWKAMRITMDF